MTAAVVLGVGLVATLDGVVLHQLLGWHHLYDRSTPDVAAAVDAVFHAVAALLVVLGGAVSLRQRRRGDLSPRRLAAGVLIGAGGFNLYDGTVQHKVFGLHQVRYGVDLVPYDIVFVGLAAVVLVAGVALLRRPAT